MCRLTPSEPACGARLILTDDTGRSGVYYDDNGRPMLGSTLVRDPAFQDLVVNETRALLATVPSPIATV
jgi:hypothetical protein